MIFFKKKTPADSPEKKVSEQPKEPAGLRLRLAKTRQVLTSLFAPGVKLDDSLLDELEDHLIMADLGVDATMQIMDKLRLNVKAGKIIQAQALLEFIVSEISKILGEDPKALSFDSMPYVLLLVGVNGVGKTTTAARLAHYYKSQGKSVMLAACDTFRAAAIEQLQMWGERLDVPVIAQQHGSDSAAVAHDAYRAAKARNIELLIIDTAGRQQTQASLMEQLAKVTRVLQKLDSKLPHETMIVLDAGNGQNALSQVSHFNEMTPLSGMVVTKLDGTAKGGVVVALIKKYGLPVYFIGVGEAMEDLRVFNAKEFSKALLPESLEPTIK